MIDATIIAGNPAWFGSCIGTLASEPVRFIYSKHIEGDFNAARIRAFDQCTSPLLSFVDPDDRVLPFAFECCHSALWSNPQAGGAFTWEEQIDANSRVLPGLYLREPDAKWIVKTPLVAHHLLVVRKRVYDAIRPFVSQHAAGFDWALAVAAERLGGLVNVPMIGYQWRIHGANSSILMRPRDDYGQRAAAFIDSRGAA